MESEGGGKKEDGSGAEKNGEGDARNQPPGQGPELGNRTKNEAPVNNESGVETKSQLGVEGCQRGNFKMVTPNIGMVSS